MKTQPYVKTLLPEAGISDRDISTQLSSSQTHSRSTDHWVAEEYKHWCLVYATFTDNQTDIWRLRLPKHQLIIDKYNLISYAKYCVIIWQNYINAMLICNQIGTLGMHARIILKQIILVLSILLKFILANYITSSCRLSSLTWVVSRPDELPTISNEEIITNS